MSSNNFILNRLFTRQVFDDLMDNHTNNTYYAIVKKYIKDANIGNNGDVIRNIYKYMSKNYRNEYFYKNTMLNKLLLGRHSINTTTALTQIPIAKSKADFILINGRAVVYEIKTELDTFERLSSQIGDYFKAFNNVCVVTSENNTEKLVNILENTPVGICILTNKNTLRFIKNPIEYNEYLSYEVLFKILRKGEFEEILSIYYNVLPNTTPVFYYDECYQMFTRIPMSILYPMVLLQLKKRNCVIQKLYCNIPYELKSLVYFYNAKEEDYLKFSLFLNSKYRG